MLLFLSASLSRRIEYCHTADEFYSTMGCLTQEMLEHNLIDPPELMQVRDKHNRSHLFDLFRDVFKLILCTVDVIFQEVYAMAVFPFPQLAELREKYTYNITPFPTSVKSSGRFVLYLF